MKKLLLWLDMYKISIKEYFNRLENNQIAFENNKNPNIVELNTMSLDGDLDIQSIVFPTPLALRTHEVLRIPYSLIPEIADPRVEIVNESDKLVVIKKQLVLEIYCKYAGQYSFTIESQSSEATKTVVVNVTPSNT